MRGLDHPLVRYKQSRQIHAAPHTAAAASFTVRRCARRRAAAVAASGQDPRMEALVDDAVVWASQHGLVGSCLSQGTTDLSTD